MKVNKEIIFIIITVCISILCVQSHRIKILQQNLTDTPTEIYKTVAHVPSDNYPDYELLFKDSSTDIAYYRLKSNVLRKVAGDTVYTQKGHSYTIIDTTMDGFTIPADEYILAGMSGTPIMDSDGKVIGYISALLDGKSVYCIWE